LTHAKPGGGFMQVLMIRIEEIKEKGIAMSIDNLSREDATDTEKNIADNLEEIYRAIGEKISPMVTIPGTRTAGA
jgi:hypothetical protein